MKKKIIIVSIVVVLLVTALLIPKTTYEKWFGLNEVPVVDDTEHLFHQDVYLKNQQGLLVGLKVPVEAISDDEIFQKWELLTLKANTLPADYTSPIAKNTTLVDYQIVENQLILNVSSDFRESDGRCALECLAWTYSNETINEIVVMVEGSVLQELNGYRFNKISKAMGINLNYETSFLYEAQATTVLYQYVDYVLPVTYFHLEEDVYSYIVQKILEDEARPINGQSYDFSVNATEMVINFLSSTELDALVLLSISTSIETNFDFDRLIINDAQTVVLETNFTSEIA